MNFLLVSVALTISNALQLHSTLAGNVGRIFNGQDAVRHQFPFIVQLEITDSSNVIFMCGGALISHKWVLTVAHCVENFHKLSVYLGLLNFEDAIKSYPLSKTNVIKHPSWSTVTSEHDIAVLFIPYTEYCDGISPIKLPKMALSHPAYVSETAVMSGWGMLNDTLYLYDDEPLQWANVVVISNELCETFYADIFHGDYELCTTAENWAGACDGDSGGPLVLLSSRELIGLIESSSDVSCQNGVPVVHTRVTYYLEWIKSVTGVWY